MKSIPFIIACLIFFQVSSQEEKVTFTYNMPIYADGKEMLIETIAQESLKLKEKHNYNCADTIEPKIFIVFIVDRNGNSTNAKIARGIDSVINNDALSVFNSLDLKWTFSMPNEEIHPVKMIIPFNLCPQDSNQKKKRKNRKK